MRVKVQKKDSRATIPTKSHYTDAGWDLYAIGDHYFAAQDRIIIDTGISMEIPEGYVGLIWPRSGLSVKKGVDVLAGVIDAGYRDSIKVCLLNTSSYDKINGSFFIRDGDRIAQILIQKIPHVFLEEHDELESSERGAAGIGSTGS